VSVPDWLQIGLITLSSHLLSSILDIALVALLIYWLLMIIRGTVAEKILIGIAILLGVGSLASTLLNLTMLSWLIRNTGPFVLSAALLVFQPELRRAHEQVGRAGSVLPHRSEATGTARTIDGVSVAAARLSERRWGALMVLEKETGLNEFVQTGVTIDGLVGAEFLLSLFYPNSPLHDGAVIIRGDRVIAAGAVLPLAESTSVGHSLGTRHRAAVGITQQTDAVVVVVSEETGQISIAHNGRLVRNLDEGKLRKVLGIIYRPAGSDSGGGPFDWLRSWLRGRRIGASPA
jgi:diadenylate cyclase